MPDIAGLSFGVAAACLVVVFVGAVMQATTGVGVGILSSPVLLLADPSFVPAAMIAAVVPLAFVVAWADRHHVDREGVATALVGRVPGMVLGVIVLRAIDENALAVIVAITVILGVIASLTTRRFQPTPPALFAAGLGSGFTGTAVGVGGPPIALTYQHADPVTMRATISLFFSVGTVLSVIALAVGGEYGSREVELTVLLLPAVMLGLVTARWFKELLTGPAVRPVVLVLSSFAAVALLVRTLA